MQQISTLTNAEWWDLPLGDPVPFDWHQASKRQAAGWSPYRVAAEHLDGEGEFDSGLVQWLLDSGEPTSDIAHFAHDRRVGSKTFFAAVMFLHGQHRGSALRRVPRGGNTPADATAGRACRGGG